MAEHNVAMTTGEDNSKEKNSKDVRVDLPTLARFDSNNNLNRDSNANIGGGGGHPTFELRGHGEDLKPSTPRNTSAPTVQFATAAPESHQHTNGGAADDTDAVENRFGDIKVPTNIVYSRGLNVIRRPDELKRNRYKERMLSAERMPSPVQYVSHGCVSGWKLTSSIRARPHTSR